LTLDGETTVGAHFKNTVIQLLCFCLYHSCVISKRRRTYALLHIITLHRSSNIKMGSSSTKTKQLVRSISAPNDNFYFLRNLSVKRLKCYCLNSSNVGQNTGHRSIAWELSLFSSGFPRLCDSSRRGSLLQLFNLLWITTTVYVVLNQPSKSKNEVKMHYKIAFLVLHY
jgi:hypothetical protein